MAKKSKVVYFCSNCGSSQPKWTGRCPDCGEWNSITEERVSTTKSGDPRKDLRPLRSLADADVTPRQRLMTRTEEFNRVLGGGFVPGSVILLGGEPGIGKSTIMLQILTQLKEDKFLYFSGEESEEQIQLRSQRLQIRDERIFISCENNLENILTQIEREKPGFVVVDSIQTVYSDQIDNIPGSVTQVKECAGRLLRVAKEQDVVIVFIGHITKEGMIAGPKVLEHLVDAVLYLEGERNNFYRILRSIKNRFGSTNEVGIFEMEDRGLVAVTNPADFFLSERQEHVAGSAVAVCMEGTRPYLIEVQGLVSSSNYGNPQRTAHGIDSRRLAMLIAVLDKRAGLPMGTQDVFLNLVGGLKIDEPAINLAIVAALASSYREVPLGSKSAFIGEVGLVGEVRSAPFIEERIREAVKFGFEHIYIPGHSLASVKSDFKKYLIGVASIGELFDKLF